MDYMFYSKVLKKPFNTLEEMKKAEAEVAKPDKKEIENKLLAELEDALDNLNMARANARKMIREANDVVDEMQAHVNAIEKRLNDEVGNWSFDYADADGNNYHKVRTIRSVKPSCKTAVRPSFFFNQW